MATSEEIRAWVYQFLAQGSLNGNLGGIETQIKVHLEQCGEFPSGPTGFHREIDNSIKDKIREIVWGLIVQGILVPGANNQQANLPFFQITEWGRKCLESGEYLPHDSGLYIARLKSQIPGVDSSIVLYLQESLSSFRAGVHLASAVMTGVASEKTLLLMRGTVEAAITDGGRKVKFAENTKDKPIKRVSDEIWKRLEPVHEQIARDLSREDLRAELSGTFDLIRKTRNEAGHPTGREISREEAHNLLLLFPQYCKAAYTVMDWLKANPRVL